jgi:hypothetical protein
MEKQNADPEQSSVSSIISPETDQTATECQNTVERVALSHTNKIEIPPKIHSSQLSFEDKPIEQIPLKSLFKRKIIFDTIVPRAPFGMETYASFNSSVNHNSYNAENYLPDPSPCEDFPGEQSEIIEVKNRFLQ